MEKAPLNDGVGGELPFAAKANISLCNLVAAAVLERRWEKQQLLRIASATKDRLSGAASIEASRNRKICLPPSQHCGGA
jgi:hypothetical protein